MTSLRARLLLWLAVLLGAVGVIGAFATYTVLLHNPDEDFDNQLRQFAFYIGTNSNESFAHAPEGANVEPEDAMVVQIWDEQGRLLRDTGRESQIPRLERSGFVDLSASGHDWRVFTSISPKRTIQIAQRTEIRRDWAMQTAWRVIYPIIALAPLILGLVLFVIARVLRPLYRLAADLAKRDAGSSTPLPVDQMPSEVKPLVLAMNALLERQQSLLDFQRRFVSDAAHQLRTPLTAVRLHAQNLDSAANPAEFEDITQDINRGLKRMSDMVAQLLSLARANAPGKPRPLERHDLVAVISSVVSDLLVFADSRRLDIGILRQVPAPILCRQHEIRTLFSNIIDNAIRYGSLGGRIDISIDLDGTNARVTVADTGPGVPETHLHLLGNRFFRLGDAETEGSGLGLAIAQAIASSHHGSLDMRNRTDGAGLLVTVILPLAP